MSEGFTPTKDALNGFCALIQNDMGRVFDQCEWLLHDAVTELAGFDDPAARDAVGLVNQARDHVRNVTYGWLMDYVRVSHDLIERMET